MSKVFIREPIESEVLECFAGEANRNHSFAADEASDTSHNLYRQFEESKWTGVGRMRLYGGAESRIVGYYDDARTRAVKCLAFLETGECDAHAFRCLFNEILG